MSEKEKQQIKGFENLEDGSPEIAKKVDTRIERAEGAKTHETQAELLQEARELASEESSEKGKLLNKLNVEQSPKEDDLSQRPVGGSLKKLTFKKEITHVRRRLSKGDRLGSKIIHQPIISSASEVSSKTITRPSGLLGGGITAFLGTTTYLYLTKYIGIRYNYSIFFFLLVGGFFVGILFEAVIRLTRGRRSI